MKPRDFERAALIRDLHADQLIQIPGVTGVTVGRKITDGRETEAMSIRIFVERKGSFQPQHRIPATFAGVPTDVEECVFEHTGSGLAEAATALTLPNTERYDPLIGGCSIGPVREVSPGHETAGTLGVLVRDTRDDDQERLLSCFHVLCQNSEWDAPGADRRVVQPGTLDGGRASSDTIGEIVRGMYGPVWRDGRNDYVDAALCDLSTGRPASEDILEVGALRGSSWAPEVGEAVAKCGRTTGATSGLVHDTNFSVRVGMTWFRRQYLVRSVLPGMPPFGARGDSGSIIMDADCYAIGMLMAVVTSPGAYYDYTVCNPMYMIEQSMGIELITS